MYSDFYICGGAIGGSADRFFGNAVLCVGVFHFCGSNDFDVGVFFVFVAYRISSGVGSRTKAITGFAHGVGFDDGAQNQIYFANCCTNNSFDDFVGIGDVAVDFV